MVCCRLFWWTNSHLHQFVADGIFYGMPGLDGPEDECDERGVLLRALPARFRDLYDFGDSWEHEVEVLGVGEQVPGCVSEDAACPPEDVRERVRDDLPDFCDVLDQDGGGNSV
jgi:Plasmid pRiA4b ORF-3-like protein